MGEFVARNMYGLIIKINKRKSCCIFFAIFIDVLRIVKIGNSGGREFADKCHSCSKADLFESREDVFILECDVQKRPAFFFFMTLVLQAFSTTP